MEVGNGESASGRMAAAEGRGKEGDGSPRALRLTPRVCLPQRWQTGVGAAQREGSYGGGVEGVGTPSLWGADPWGVGRGAWWGPRWEKREVPGGRKEGKRVLLPVHAGEGRETLDEYVAPVTRMAPTEIPRQQ